MQYLFFHDYNVFNCKYLDLHQKWPRPGRKSLEKFIEQNQVIIVATDKHLEKHYTKHVS